MHRYRYISRLLAFALLVLQGLVLGANLFADEAEQRRVEISMSIFPRIVAVDNDFRNKLMEGNRAQLMFVYDKDARYAQKLAEQIKNDSDNIGGMAVETAVVNVADELSATSPPTAIFITEKLTDAKLQTVMEFANATQRLVFSPFLGDVERGVTVGISVTNRVKPFFNLPALRTSKVTINALLMKMSKRHE
ncbi:MAG: hypothetical protein RRB22_00785 [Gammaproteobacteria bacterium]|nr:hypothetical protein [Gammaproteobacteria bacterium]